jgi:hypothetical protein
LILATVRYITVQDVNVKSGNAQFGARGWRACSRLRYGRTRLRRAVVLLTNYIFSTRIARNYKLL